MIIAHFSIPVPVVIGFLVIAVIAVLGATSLCVWAIYRVCKFLSATPPRHDNMPRADDTRGDAP